MHNRILYRLTWLALAMSLGHHLDHLVRGNAVSWPLTGQVNAFTFSLGVYPVIATRLGAVPCRPGRARVLGRGLRRRRRLRQRRALRPLGGRTPRDGPGPDPYDPPVLGWLAFAWLVAFVAVLAITCVYETRLWWQQRQARHATQPATGAGTQR